MSRHVNSAPTTPATLALDALGISYTTHPYAHDPNVTAYGLEAAQALGVEADEVFKTLVVRLDTRAFAVVVLPVSATADLKAAAVAVGAKKAVLAEAKDVQRLSGYVPGGVSPIGGRTHLPTVIDASASRHERIYVSGGRRGFDVALAPLDLLRACDGVIAPVARG